MSRGGCVRLVLRHASTNGVADMRSACDHTVRGHDDAGCMVCRAAGYEGHEHDWSDDAGNAVVVGLRGGNSVAGATQDAPRVPTDSHASANPHGYRVSSERATRGEVSE